MGRDPILSETDEAAARAIGSALEARYRAVAEGSMRDMPLSNPALGVAAVGFTAYGGKAVGIVATPWFMNLVMAALPGRVLSAARIGDAVTHALPSGDYECVVGELDGFGRLDSVSLFSPMFEFADAETAVATAEAAMAEVMKGAEAVVAATVTAPAAAETPRLDRRALLFGRRGHEGERSCR